MEKIKFYSENDLSCGQELRNIIDMIKNKTIDVEFKATNFIEFYNILKYFAIDRFSKFIEEETSIEVKVLQESIRKKMSQFIAKEICDFNKLYNEIDYLDTEDFLEIIEKYKLYQSIDPISFKQFLDNKHIPVYMVMKHKNTTEKFDLIVKGKILSEPNNAEIILSKYLGDNLLFLPPSLLHNEVLELIDEYIDSPTVNVNQLRSIVTFPNNTSLKISDKIRLHAKKIEAIENRKIFEAGSGIESSITVSYPSDLNSVLEVSRDGTKIDIKVNRNWIEDHLDFPTLWNNFIYLFNIVDNNFRLTLVSKTNSIGAFESILLPSGSHLYRISHNFTINELMADVKINSYLSVIASFDITIEKMIEWFFIEYLKIEFAIDNFIIKMPSINSPYFEKCRSILPELDRIFKQFNTVVVDHVIDQELIQISSSSFKTNEIRSFNTKKYVYPIGEWYRKASYLLFSNQSSIFYVKNIKDTSKNFIELIQNNKVKENDFSEYQLNNIKWLFNEALIYIDDDGYIKMNDLNLIYVLKELYYEEVLSYWRCNEEIKKTIDLLECKGVVVFENTLFTRNEQDFLDYYLNKSKFTNGLEIRNRYLHGTNSNDENQYKADYYIVIKLIIIIVIKINDDLCIRDDFLNV